MAQQVYSLTITTNVANQIAQNILHYQFDDAAFATREAAAAALITAWDTANRTAFKAMLPSAVKLLSLKARCVDAAGGFEAFFAFPAGQTGSRAGTVPVSGVSPVVKKVGLIYTHRIGKIFLPGVSDLDQIDGEYQAGFITAIGTNKHIFTDTLTLVGGGAPTAIPGIFNKNKLPKFVHTIYSALTPYPGTQRRRQLPV